VLAVASTPLVVGFALLHAEAVRRTPDDGLDGLDGLPTVAEGLPAAPHMEAVAPGAGSPAVTSAVRPEGMLQSTVRQPAVLLAAAMLVAYVGLEIGVGTWAYSALVIDRGLGGVLAGLLVSGYWLGLTLGRLLIEPFSRRAAWSLERTVTVCVVGVIVAFLAIWIIPTTFVAAAGLGVAGFFLGPIFPGIMVATPRITQAALVATAIGVLNGVSVLGGSVLPWLAGFLGEHIALWTLWPYAIGLGLVQLGLWRLLTPRMAENPAPSTT
jgi:fucose permease